MDEDTFELIQLLCTRAGMIMEDASAEALVANPGKAEEMRAKLRRLADAAQAIGAIVAAAQALHHLHREVR
jgi:hypothetical protein